jgi:uncharacterized protein (DUF1800 family)
MDDTIRALNRFGLGARARERDSIAAPRDWLRAQLDAFDPIPRDLPDLDESYAVFLGFGHASQAEDEVRLKELRGRLGVIRAKGVHAMLRTRVTSDTPFVERLVAFWSNHLCVSVASKRRVAALAHDYECSVVRRHVLGRYEDMVLASARHPAMLLYLDNVASIGPESIVGTQLREAGDPRGLNENYAR